MLPTLRRQPREGCVWFCRHAPQPPKLGEGVNTTLIAHHEKVCNLELYSSRCRGQDSGVGSSAASIKMAPLAMLLPGEPFSAPGSPVARAAGLQSLSCPAHTPSSLQETLRAPRWSSSRTVDYWGGKCPRRANPRRMLCKLALRWSLAAWAIPSESTVTTSEPSRAIFVHVYHY